MRKIRQSCRINFIHQPFLILIFNFSHKCPCLLSWVKAGTHSPSPTGSHTRVHTPKQGCFGRGWYHYPRTVSHVSETLRGQGVERQTLPLLGLGRGCSQRTQRAFGTAMRLCASLFRGVAAPLGCVIFFRFCRNYGFHTLCSGLSACAKEGWYHYPRRALRVAKTPDGRLSKRLICSFLVFPIYICERPRRALPISALIQIDCCWISCGQTACP